MVLGACEVPDDLADDPLAVTASLDLNDVTAGAQTHVVRIAVDEASSIPYSGGFGGVYAVDVSGATQAIAQWGMAPYVLADRALLAEWNLVDVVAFDAADRAPQVDPTPSAVYCPGPAESVVVHNRGGSDLRLTGASVDDPRFTFTAAADLVAPGGSVALDVAFADDGAPADASLCLATDDPDEPVVHVALTTVAESLGATLCGAAPDFSLPDLGGATRSLVDERGIPVLILFFSTW